MVTSEGAATTPVSGEAVLESEPTFEVGHSLIFVGPRTTVLLGRKVTTSLERVLKSRDITLLTKVRLVKAMVFP